MDERRLAAVRRWATELPADPEGVELQTAARAVLAAAESTNGHDGYALDGAESWARRSASRADDPELRFAASILLLPLPHRSAL